MTSNTAGATIMRTMSRLDVSSMILEDIINGNRESDLAVKVTPEENRLYE
jgi:hypothetical protein